ncbi:Uma2 family endonuclease [Gemmata sp.]|uniref:Uma2 family endonuclease n=1 Tax=Gemmata sp. TaxID=1914242 RepID=UPI003F6F42AB
MEPSRPIDPQLEEYLDAEADRYLRSLRPEHIMEAMPQATQRKITLESFDVIRAMRPDVQCFNELLVQYPRGKRKRLGQVVPDNFVVVHSEAIESLTSYNLHTQPASPVLVLEYVSKQSERKDYDENFEKYEEDLKVPYYLLFYPDNEEMTLFRLSEKGYSAVPPNPDGRHPVPELELEAGLLGGWVRFWFRRELVALPADLVHQLSATRDQLAAVKLERDTERQARLAAEAEIAKLREELAKAKGSPS